MRTCFLLLLHAFLLVAPGCAADIPDDPHTEALTEPICPIDGCNGGGGGGGGGAYHTCYADNDRDGLGAGRGVRIQGSCSDLDYSAVKTDCDDGNPSILGPTSCYADRDGDGYGGDFAVSACACPVGTTWRAGDCDDYHAEVHPITCRTDNDHDGQPGDGRVTVCGASCEQVGYPGQNDDVDCDDSNAGRRTARCLASDNDGDGYGASAPVCTSAGDCSPFNRSRDADCNDGNAAVHPYNREIAVNSVDDDCNGLIDEARWRYSPEGSMFAHITSISPELVLNDLRVIRWVQSGRPLFAKATYFPLNDSSNVTTVVSQAWVDPQDVRRVVFWIDGLRAGTLYRVELSLHSDASGSDASGFFNGRSAETDRMASAPSYFTMTLGGADDYAQELGARAVRQALYERNEWEDGAIRDGDHYCGAIGSCGKWCSEFYSQMIRPWFHAGTGRLQTDDVIDEFADRNSYMHVDVQRHLVDGSTRPGDYLAVAENRTSDVNHSAMFLAYDIATNTVVTIAGNVDDRVKILTYYAPLDDRIHGIGHLTTAMIR
jgi:Putative metal-binding motif